MGRALTRSLGSVVLAASLVTAGAAAAAPGPDRVPAGEPTAPVARLIASADVDAPRSVGPTPRREIHSEVVRDEHRLWLRGDVEAYAGRLVAVQRKGCDTCRWQLHEITRTGKRGGFRSGIWAPRKGSTYWRATVPKSDGYARSSSAVWETYY